MVYPISNGYGVNPTIITPPENPELLKASKNFVRGGPIIKKSWSEKSEFYASNILFPSIRERGTRITETYARGGLSNIWGTVCFPESLDMIKKLGISAKQYTQYKEFVCNELNITDIESSVWKSFENPTETFLVEGLPSLSLDSKGGPWNARTLWEDLNNPSFEFIEGVVTHFEVCKSAVLLHYLDSSNTSQARQFDFVFCAAGPFGNARLWLKSNPERRSLEIRDSAVEYRIALHKHLDLSASRTQNTPFRFLRYVDHSQGVDLYIQLYTSDESKLDYITNPLLRHFLLPFWKILSRFFVIAIVFYSQEHSESITITYDDKGNFSSSGNPPRKNRKSVKPYLRKVLKLNNFHYTPFMLKGRPGSGVHSGAFLSDPTSDSSNEKEVDNLFSRVQFIGASNLIRVPTGPITFVSLIQSIHAAEKFLRKFKFIS